MRTEFHHQQRSARHYSNPIVISAVHKFHQQILRFENIKQTYTESRQTNTIAKYHRDRVAIK